MKAIEITLRFLAPDATAEGDATRIINNFTNLAEHSGEVFIFSDVTTTPATDDEVEDYDLDNEEGK